MLFGRGGEEALALAAAGIAFRIVPGISAGVGGLASIALPATHRGVGRSIAFATGHATAEGDPDWPAMARAADTLVLYMARGRMAGIAAGLMAGGRAADEPVAFVSDATTPRQRVRITTLAEAGAVAAAIPPEAATLVVVGRVVALRDAIAPWLQTPPAGRLPVAAPVAAPIVAAVSGTA
jgi:uroporphyrin-III C-methyltransferase